MMILDDIDHDSLQNSVQETEQRQSYLLDTISKKELSSGE